MHSRWGQDDQIRFLREKAPSLTIHPTFFRRNTNTQGLTPSPIACVMPTTEHDGQPGATPAAPDQFRTV
jgi:hypothetical protein